MVIDIKKFLPPIYTGYNGELKKNYETDIITNVENKLLNTSFSEFLTVCKNQFIVTSDVSGIEKYEKLLSIIANPANENLEFRRQRIINRMSMQPPYTFTFLEQRLDSIIGVGNWEAYIDFDNYTLYVESLATNQQWYYELFFTIGKIKPANIVFVNYPYINNTIKINSEYSYSIMDWNYRAGTTAFANYIKPLINLNEKGVFKMAQTKSFTPKMLNMVVENIKANMSHMVINESYYIPVSKVEFTILDNKLTASFQLKKEDFPENTIIQKVQFIDHGSNILDNVNCYVPLLDDIQMKLNINAIDGV